MSCSTGMVHLANTDSKGGSTSGEEKLSECDMAALSSETKRNTQQNESMGEGVADTEDTAPRNLLIVMIEIILSDRITTAISSCPI